MTYHRLHSIDPSANIDIDTLRFIEPVVSNEEGDMVCWYSATVRNNEHKLYIIEASHFLSLDVAPETHVPKDFWNAMAIPEWNKAIETDQQLLLVRP